MRGWALTDSSTPYGFQNKGGGFGRNGDEGMNKSPDFGGGGMKSARLGMGSGGFGGASKGAGGFGMNGGGSVSKSLGLVVEA